MQPSPVFVSRLPKLSYVHPNEALPWTEGDAVAVLSRFNESYTKPHAPITESVYASIRLPTPLIA